MGSLLLAAYQILLIDGSPPVGAVGGLFGVTAFVLDPGIRQNTMHVILTLGFPLIAGIIYAAWKAYQATRQTVDAISSEILRLSLLGFSASWLLWYTLFSIGWDRYLFPAMFIGSIFIAALLDNLTAGFDFKGVIRHASTVILQRQVSRDGMRAWLAICLVAVSLPLTVSVTLLLVINQKPTATEQTAVYLNSSLPPEAHVETYESELLHLLDVPYHIPPDPVHVQVVIRRMFNSSIPIDYDPPDNDPVYLVLGGYNRDSKLYDPFVENGEIRFIKEYPGYEIYARTR